MASYGEVALVRSMGFLADKQAAVSNNLANVNTDGYKRRESVVQTTQPTFKDLLGANLPEPRYSERSDWSKGTVRQSGSRYHASIEGDGLFTVQSPEGQQYYTRRGEFSINSEGYLTTPQGDVYLSADNEPLQVGDSASPVKQFSIGPDGTLTEDGGDGRTFGRLNLVTIDNKDALEPIGRGLFRDTAGQLPGAGFAGIVRQGTLEGSNVQTVDEMVRMMEVQRTFQATQRALTGIGRLHAGFVSMMNR